MHVKIIFALFLHLFSFTFSQRKEAEEFLRDYNENFATFINEKYKAMFIRAVNITDYNIKQESLANDKFRVELGKVRERARTFNLTDCDFDTKRQFKMLLTTKVSINNVTAKKVEDLANNMKIIYGKTTIPYNSTYIKAIPQPQQPTLHLGDIQNIMGKSKDPEELLYVWKALRTSISSQLRNKYETYVKLNNIGARENGFNDAGEYHRSFYDVPDLKTIVEDFLKALQPFYQELHGYIRYHLKTLYPNLVDPDGLIPAHLVGNTWAQSWEGLYKRVVPYPQEPTLDVTPTLEKNESIDSMLIMAEEFFTSLGWQKLPKTFWDKSVFKKPTDRQVECYPSAMDLKIKEDGEPDVRIKLCMQKTQRDFITIHHEIGHIYYDLFYWDQPLQYRDGANPGFHEAVGDFITLSMQTPAHLNTVGLLEEISQTKEADINFLMKTALEQISFLPFAFVMDQWMWNVYTGDIKPSEYNDKWWEYREKYQGIKNPVGNNSSKNDFDPGAKFHIPGDVPYIRYFFASILMFTFHKRACDLSNNTKPLHQCSIYKSKIAGKAFGEMLALGRSKPWPEALKQYTGSEKISVDPVKEYFNPLIEWLKNYRKKHNYQVGWDSKADNETKSKSNHGVRIQHSYLIYLIYSTLFIFTLI
jgi:peptidyl-dipeptidase A